MFIMHGNTPRAMILSSMSTIEQNTVSAWPLQALQTAVQRQHRCLFVLAGSPAWAQAQLLPWATQMGGAWLGADESGEGVPDAIPAARARQVLGSEYPLAVVDAWQGLHPDALAAVAGTVQAGGALFLLVPPLADWPSRVDPDYVRLASYPREPASLSRHFINRLAARCVPAAGIVVLEERLGDSLPAEVSSHWPVSTDMAVESCPAAEQQAILQQWLHSNSSAVLLARRGRGKSALLGFMAAHLHAKGAAVLLTAPSRAAAASVFRHAQYTVPFMAPDAILADANAQADVLLVDEAATISLPVLADLLPRFPRILFATTTDGYEGTGQGFLLRFLSLLDQQSPGWERHTLSTPRRWAVADPLEAWLDDALLLNAQASEMGALSASASTLHLQTLSQIRLCDEPLLTAVYGLLRNAHYRTTPDDLRFLLDGPGVSLYIASVDNRIVAVALLVREGEIDATMRDAIVSGLRRPRGHMLVQALAVQAQQPQYLGVPVARVLRIAVHPMLQGKGIGSAVLQHAVTDQHAQGVQVVGSSFSATPDVLAFWQKNGFRLVHMGHRRQAASAAPSALVLHEGE